MIFHELNNDGFPNWAGQVERGEEIIFDKYLHLDTTKTLMAFEIDEEGNQVAVTGATIEGRYYSDTDLDYEDLSVGHDLSAAASTYERYLVRITADAGASVEDKHYRLILV